jgi:hypothetical protein
MEWLMGFGSRQLSKKCSVNALDFSRTGTGSFHGRESGFESDNFLLGASVLIATIEFAAVCS